MVMGVDVDGGELLHEFVLFHDDFSVYFLLGVSFLHYFINIELFSNSINNNGNRPAQLSNRVDV